MRRLHSNLPERRSQENLANADSRMLKNIIITGIGGQGTVTAAGLLRRLALEAGFRLRGSDNRGGAQRLGHVSAIVRYTDEPDRPMAPEIPDQECDLLISLEATEGLRFARAIGPRTIIIFSRRIVIPTNQRRARLPYLNLSECEHHYGVHSKKVLSADFDRIAGSRFGKAVLANFLMLGMGIREALPELMPRDAIHRLPESEWPSSSEPAPQDAAKFPEAFRQGLTSTIQDFT